MREFRAGPAKILRQALRTGAVVHVGDFVLRVQTENAVAPAIFGALSSAVDPGRPDDWLSADDAWDTDG
jgi:hypothetical protein